MLLDERQVQRLAQAVVPLVMAKIASALSGALDGGRVYSTRTGCAPAGYSRDRWRAVAHQIGTKRGRWWVVTAERLAAYEDGERDPKPPTGTPANDAPARPWHPSMSAEAAGMRPVGVGGGRGPDTTFAGGGSR
jgi:hypothetical protein